MVTNINNLIERIQDSNKISDFFKKKYINLLNIAHKNFLISKTKLETVIEEVIEKAEITIEEEQKKIAVSSKKKTPSISLTPFIVHGHDELSMMALKNFLQNSLKFKEPVILKHMPSGGQTIIEKFEHYSELIDVVFVLLTPDDTLLNSTKRARQNVILELGYFMGKLGRKSGRIILLRKGKLEIPSDIKGLINIDISNGIEMSFEKIRNELNDIITFN